MGLSSVKDVSGELGLVRAYMFSTLFAVFFGTGISVEYDFCVDEGNFNGLWY